MDFIAIFSDVQIAGNSLVRIFALFGVLLVAMIAGKITQHFSLKTAETFENKNNPIAAVALKAVAHSVVLLLFAFALKYGLLFLHMSPKVTTLADNISGVLIVLAIGWLIYCLLDLVDVTLGQMAAKTESRLDDMLVPMVRKTLRVTVVILVLVQIAQTLSDQPITSIIAGLGVGGLAVALAAQETIKNFFGSLVILADKPFELGDRIVVDGHDGPVEEVGFRSTKIRTLDGHLISIPNGELANRTIQNIGRRPYIKRVMNITVTYDTPPEKLQRAIEILRKLLKDHEGMDPELPPKVHFSDFNSDSLNILVLYWYHPPLYWDFLEFGERLNMEILRRFNDEGIDFAFPTQTLYLAGDTSRPLHIGVDMPDKNGG